MIKRQTVTRLALVAALAGSAFALPAQAQGAEQVLQPEAAEALNRIGASLRQLKRFEVTSEARLERAYEAGPTLEFRQDMRFLVQMPDQMAVDITTDQVHRKVFYNGKDMTVVGMKAGKYVNVPMQGSISDVMTLAYNELGIDFPLQDLFRWGSPSAVIEAPTEGFRVGDSVVRGQKVAHYAYRMPDVDFQIWMTEGERPLPLRMVIVGRETPRLRYTADLTWNLSPSVNSQSFVFRPRPGDVPITVDAVKATAR